MKEQALSKEYENGGKVYCRLVDYLQRNGRFVVGGWLSGGDNIEYHVIHYKSTTVMVTFTHQDDIGQIINATQFSVYADTNAHAQQILSELEKILEK